MNIRRYVAPALVGLALVISARPAQAQQAGSLDFSGFLQLDRLDAALRTKQLGGGAGGSIGIFLSPRWEIAAEASYSQGDAAPPRPTKAQINYYVGRLNYNIPWGGTPGNAVILSAGAGGDRIDAHSDFIVAPELGLRTMLTENLGLKLGLGAMLAFNPNSGTFKYPATVGVNSAAAYMANYQARIGLSFLTGVSRPAPPAPVVAAPAPAPTPAPAPPVVDNSARDRARQDSIDAANRARQAALDASAKALADARALLNAPIWFDYDKSEIRADAKSTLDSKLGLLRANPSMKIRIEGNTDSRGSNEYNMALGLRRANAARRYLVAQGIEESRFEVVSYGEERPVDSGTTEDAYQKNRRDDFVITVGGDNISVPR
ncbi:MAG: peptidoglycan-associated lipoprotein [Gemmatimonadetes bacterium]|nr:peptidoglycan-associated lipoprotein [Gemmatimonadota bacterium]